MAETNMAKHDVAQHADPEKTPSVFVEDTEARALTKSILWKLDTRVVPPLALLYLCNFLDRANVGNANILGLSTDLGITPSHYATALAVFFIFYVVSELPSNLILKRATPKVWLPILATAWGIVVLSLGFVRNYASFTVVRALLGLTEGGLYPGCLLYLSTMYTRQELALRIGIFYSMASLSGAFGGILARGLSAIPTTEIVNQKWRWIFIIEGLITLAAGFIAVFLIPDSVETVRYFSDAEKKHARLRIKQSHSVEGSRTKPETFSWSEVRRGMLSLQVWFAGSAYFAICCALFSFSLFLPSIIVGLGYTDPNQAQLMTVPPYAAGTVMAVVISILSDRLHLRGTLSLFTLPLAIIGYAVIARVDSNSVKFGMTFLMAVGIYSSVPPILVWVLNNSAGHYKRATSGALQVCMANVGGIVAAFLYPSTQSPRYYKSHNVAMGLLCYAWLAILCNVLYCKKINRDKANGKYNAYTGSGDDRDPAFKMVI
ncbi:unnamed protein product [Clonostachys rosea]|uniref:Major facilitator superfamily (MFS) profile domain-containing protein n=1 Tax=Bionectria ochroleuca TaxID=29856 RepID=A0ABY6UGV9_BIOOC|nr:unnamed protein product [Clonostachys rosea]